MIQDTRYNTGTLRRDTQNLARTTGGAAGAWFWGILGTIALLRGIFSVLAKVPVADWIGIGSGLAVAGFFIMLVLAFPHPGHGLQSPPPGPMPDLRASDVFEGKR